MPRVKLSSERPVDEIGRTAALVIAMSGILLGTGIALADEGSFSLLRSMVRDYTTIDHGEVQFTGGSILGTGTVLQSSGGPFVEGAASIVSCVVYARTSEVGVDLEAPCTMTDGEGDHLHHMARRSSGDVDEGGEGRVEFLGGTGKYARIGGTCTYDTAYLPKGHAVTMWDCTWKRAAE